MNESLPQAGCWEWRELAADEVSTGAAPTQPPCAQSWDEPAVRWQLIHEHRDSLLAAVAHLCADPADAEDHVHDAFLQVAQQADVDPQRVGGLLRTIATRRALDGHRDRARHQRALCRLGLDESTRGADDVAVDRWEAGQLAAVTRTLPSAQRRAIAGRAAGYAARETAAEFGVPVKTVHLALCRARTTLKAVATAALGVLLWRRRRMSSVSPHVASGVALALTGAVLVLIHFATPPTVRSHIQVRADTAAATIRPAVSRLPSVGLTTPGPARMGRSDRESQAAHAQHAPAAGPGSPQLAVSLGRPGLVGTGVTLSKTHPNQSFVESLKACLAPGGLSLDPHHAGCTAGP